MFPASAGDCKNHKGIHETLLLWLFSYLFKNPSNPLSAPCRSSQVKYTLDKKNRSQKQNAEMRLQPRRLQATMEGPGPNVELFFCNLSMNIDLPV